mgnify:CR=1 FL=1
MLQSVVCITGKGKARCVVALEMEWSKECEEEERVAVGMTKVLVRLVPGY